MPALSEEAKKMLRRVPRALATCPLFTRVQELERLRESVKRAFPSVDLSQYADPKLAYADQAAGFNSPSKSWGHHHIRQILSKFPEQLPDYGVTQEQLKEARQKDELHKVAAEGLRRERQAEKASRPPEFWKVFRKRRPF